MLFINLQTIISFCHNTVATGEYRVKIAVFEAGWVILTQNFTQKGASPTNYSMFPKNYMNLPFIRYKNLGGNFVRFVTIHVCDGHTDTLDGRTDTFAVRKTALHICSAVKIYIA